MISMPSEQLPPFALVAGAPGRTRTDVLVLFVAESSRPEGPLAEVDRTLDGRLLRAAREEGFRGKAEQLFTFHTQGRLSAERVVVAGLGRWSQFDGEALRQAAGRAVKAAQRL